MKRSLMSLTLLIILGLALASCGTAGGGADKTFKVGIVQQVTHPALDGAREGVKKAFADAGVKAEFIEKNAQNDVPTLTTIAEGFRDSKVEMVIAIGTLPLQTSYKVLKDSRDRHRARLRQEQGDRVCREAGHESR